MKNWYQSKTIWTNGLTVAAGAAAALANVDWLNGKIAALALAAAGSANILLRFVTTSPVAGVLLKEENPVPEVIHRHIVEVVKGDINHETTN